MPELPEVEATRRLVESHVKGDTVTHVHTKEGGGGPRHGLFDDIVVGEVRASVDPSSFFRSAIVSL